MRKLHACVDAGARFSDQPGFVRGGAYANNVNVVVLPGALDATKLSQLGKRFRISQDFLQSYRRHQVRAALKVRFLNPLIATGGVNQVNASDFILAGATAIGVGGELLPRSSTLSPSRSYL